MEIFQVMIEGAANNPLLTIGLIVAVVGGSMSGLTVPKEDAKGWSTHAHNTRGGLNPLEDEY